MKGWYGNRYGHSLASCGIKTKGKLLSWEEGFDWLSDMYDWEIKMYKDIYCFPEVINYNNSEEIVIGFWFSSLKNDFSKFDFEKAFSNLYQDVKNYAQFNIDCIYGFSNPEKEKPSLDFLYSLYNNNKKEYNNMIREVISLDSTPEYFDLMNEIKNRNNILKDNIILMDKVIHTQHHSRGDWVLEGNDGFLDIDTIRAKTEQFYQAVEKGRIKL